MAFPEKLGEVEEEEDGVLAHEGTAWCGRGRTRIQKAIENRTSATDDKWLGQEMIRLGKVKSSQVKPSQVKSNQVKSSQDTPSPIRSQMQRRKT